jgi:RNA polymerase sigma-70 factor (ECF subfamily)
MKDDAMRGRGTRRNTGPECGGYGPCNLWRDGRFSIQNAVTDESLMRAVRDGDVNQLGPLFERYHTRLFAFLYRMTGRRAAAEDLVQDVFVRVLRYRATFRDEGRFDTWIFRIARNVRVDHFRHLVPEDPLEGPVLDRPSPEPGPGVRLERVRDHERLECALARLRDDRRELIVLARYEAMPHDQIAEILGIDVGAVKVRLHRAVAELRDLFHEDPRAAKVAALSPMERDL